MQDSKKPTELRRAGASGAPREQQDETAARANT